MGTSLIIKTWIFIKTNYNVPFKNLREDANEILYMPFEVEFRAIKMPIILKLINSVILYLN